MTSRYEEEGKRELVIDDHIVHQEMQGLRFTKAMNNILNRYLLMIWQIYLNGLKRRAFPFQM